MLARLARSCYRRRRRVLVAWILVFVAAIAVAPALAGDHATSGSLPGTDSQEAYDLLGEAFPQRQGDEGQLVFPDVGADPSRVDGFLVEVADVDGVIGVEEMQLAPDGEIGTVAITLANEPGQDPQGTADEVKALARELRDDGVPVELSGAWFTPGEMPASELIGVMAAIIVLLVAFGSLVAMGVPIVTALMGVAIGLAGVGLAANVFTTPEFAPQVAAMIGIGVGIDYALFIVTRYREALYRIGSPEAAVVEAVTTSGRAVLFAGCTVMISILGMFLMGLDFLHGLAIGTSIAVLVAMCAAVTLLPAMLGFLGFNIDKLRVGRRRTGEAGGWWQRWARIVQRRPAIVAFVGLTVLVLAALPTLGLRLGAADASNDPVASTTHRAYQLIADGFGPGANGPVLVVADTSEPGSIDALTGVLDRLRAEPGVASVSGVQPSPDGSAALATLIATHGPQDEETESLVHRLRDDVIPSATAGTGLEIHLGGQTAGSVDFADVIGDRLPIFIGAVLALSFLLLLVVFRSVLVPLKAVVMNLLSIGAAYGVIVATFQWGWGADLLGISGAPIEPWVPMMLFAIVFGLSMDYEVFLLSAIREHYDRTGDNARAVADGLAGTARVITAAALIMFFVFGSFVVSDVRALKLIGLGLAVAVAVDASIVRIVLVPATMELLGRANWWLPRWLDRVLPRVSVEGPAEPVPVPVTADA